MALPLFGHKLIECVNKQFQADTTNLSQHHVDRAVDTLRENASKRVEDLSREQLDDLTFLKGLLEADRQTTGNQHAPWPENQLELIFMSMDRLFFNEKITHDDVQLTLGENWRRDWGRYATTSPLDTGPRGSTVLITMWSFPNSESYQIRHQARTAFLSAFLHELLHAFFLLRVCDGSGA